MIRPLENQERLHPTEYVNRVKQTEPTNSTATRDFSYEINELTREGKHREQQSKEFGEDVYEPSKEEQPPEESEDEQRRRRDKSKGPDDHNLDVVV